MKQTCIDISYWNGGDIDFKKVKAAGIEAVIIRAGFGNSASQIDKHFLSNYQRAKAAGLKIGAYWYSYAGGADPIADALKEAAACLTVIKGKSFDLPIYFDIEEQSKPNIPAYGRTTCTRICETFCDAIKRGGYRAGVYSNPNWFSNYLNYSTLAAKYSIWLAQWANSYSYNCDIWQNSEKGRVNGINTNVDMNVIINRSVIKGAPADDGDKDIKAVQKWLNTTYKTGLTIDGIYGAKTRAALVKALQTEINRHYGAKLAVDGVFGDKTYNSIPNVKKGAYGELTRVLQGLLICHGYSTGGFDGIFGAQTENAVKAFQRVKGLYVDGIAGRNTFKQLCT